MPREAATVVVHLIIAGTGVASDPAGSIAIRPTEREGCFGNLQEGILLSATDPLLIWSWRDQISGCRCSAPGWSSILDPAGHGRTGCDARSRGRSWTCRRGACFIATRSWRRFIASLPRRWRASRSSAADAELVLVGQGDVFDVPGGRRRWRKPWAGKPASSLIATEGVAGSFLHRGWEAEAPATSDPVRGELARFLAVAECERDGNARLGENAGGRDEACSLGASDGPRRLPGHDGSARDPWRASSGPSSFSSTYCFFFCPRGTE